MIVIFNIINQQFNFNIIEIFDYILYNLKLLIINNLCLI
jgi:hypothetical protein